MFPFVSAAFRNEGKWSKGRFGEEGGLEPFGPSSMAFPTGASSCFFPASALPKSQRGSPAPAPPLRTPTPVLVTAVPQGRVWPAQARHVAARPRRRSLAGDQDPWNAGGESRFPGGRGGSANRLRQPRPYRRKSAFRAGLATGGGGPGPAPTGDALRGRTPGTRPRAWPEGHWAVAFVQPLPMGRMAMGPSDLASDPGDAQPRPAPPPTVRGQQIFN